MSGWEWVGLAQTRRLGDARPKAVLNFLANAADESGESWWSTERIAASTDISVRTVRKILATFEADGLLHRERRRNPATGQLGTWRHRLCWEAIAALPWNGITLRGRGDGDPFSQVAPGAPRGHLDESPGAPRGHLANDTPGSPGQVTPGVTTEPQGMNPSGEPQTPPTPPAPDAAQLDLGVVPPSEPKVDRDRPHKARAHEVTRKVFERKKPRPVTPFVAAAQIAERFLDRGDDPQVVGQAMVDAPTISLRAVELRISQLLEDQQHAAGKRRPGPTADQRAGIITHADDVVDGVIDIRRRTP